MIHKRVVVMAATALLMAGPLVNLTSEPKAGAAGVGAHALVQDATDAPPVTSAPANGRPAWRSIGAVLLLSGLTGLGGWFAYRRVRTASDEDDDRSLPPLLFPLKPQGSHRIAWEMAAAARTAASSHGAGNGNAAARHAQAGNARGTTAVGAPAGAASGSAAATFALADAEWGTPVQAGPIRFHRPPDGTLQLLPGRLEILSGSFQEEIRFVKLTGRDPVITFGRSEGEPHAHIQLAAPTVSRMHASMRFLDGHWHIANLSDTNPVVVNGKPLGLNGADQLPLNDGDTVEMGQVVFRFRVR